MFLCDMARDVGCLSERASILQADGAVVHIFLSSHEPTKEQLQTSILWGPGQGVGSGGGYVNTMRKLGDPGLTFRTRNSPLKGVAFSSEQQPG